MVRPILLSVFAGILAVAAGQKCFALDGSELDDTYAPCSKDTQFAGCCATKRTVGAEICLDNGLCMATSRQQTGMIWQNGCSDPTGQSAFCPGHCPDRNKNFNGLPSTKSWNLQMCDIGTYCCRALGDSASCCDNATAPRLSIDSIGAFKVAASAVAASVNPGSAVATAVSTGSPFSATSTATPTSTPAPSQNECQSERQQFFIVGGTLGGLFGIIIIVLSALVFWMYKKERKERKLKEHYEEQFVQTNSYRKVVESNAGSVRGSILLDPLDFKSNGSLEKLKIKISSVAD